MRGLIELEKIAQAKKSMIMKSRVIAQNNLVVRLRSNEKDTEMI